jgi:hypothetical protein
MQAGPPGVDVAYRRDVIASTSRITVAFRVILALPHIIVLWALGYGVAVVTIVAWFAALFTARVPEGIYGFIGWVVRYGARVMSYVWLLTDRWPTFTESPEDPVHVQLPGPQRLNRAAVFFRLVLMIPAAILASVLNAGLAVAGFFIWLIVLIRGRVPQPVFDGGASVVRYQTRFYAYLTLLTARYPSGVYGDPGAPTDASATTDVATPPVINRAAKRMVILFIVLGIIGVVGEIAVSAAVQNNARNRRVADDRLSKAYHSLQFTNASTCLGVSDQLNCATEAARQNAAQLRTFKEDIGGIDFPSDASDDVNAVQQATNHFIADFDALSHASTLQDYRSIASGSGITGDGKAFDDSVSQLSDDLANSGS